MKLARQAFNMMMVIMPSALLFASASPDPSLNTIRAEEDMGSHQLHLEQIKPSTVERSAATVSKAKPLKCKNSDSKLELQLKTKYGDSIPFFCAWAPKKGPFSCTATGPLASHCPYTCKTCSTYKCADSEGKFIWKKQTRDCPWLA